MWQRFTERARRVILLGQEEAAKMSAGHVGTEHLLLGLLSVDDGVAVAVLRQAGVSRSAVRTKALARIEASEGAPRRDWLGRPRAAPEPTPEPKLTPEAKHALELAADEARRMKHSYIGTEHMLLALLREKKGGGAQVLGEVGLSIEGVREQVRLYLTQARPRDPSALLPLDDSDWAALSDTEFVPLLRWMLHSENAALDILVACGLDVEAARQKTQQLLDGNPE